MACLALGGILSIALYQTAHSSVFLADASAQSESTKPADAQRPVLDGRVDPNTAQWYDMTQLPRVGEALARRIVAYREAKILEWRSAHPREPIEYAPPIFTNAEDLLPVKGIGPKTLDLLRPHLCWPEKGPAPRVTPQAK
jgi:DNA uptake protein ComE-like DNA-binding protein